MRKKIYVVVLLSLMLLGSSCNIEDEYAPINEYGNIDLNKVPYNKLSDYRFFTGDMNELNPAQGVYSYNLTSSLFSDFASKERLIYLRRSVCEGWIDESYKNHKQKGVITE